MSALLREGETRRERWREGVEALSRTPGVAGVLLVAREGCCVLGAWPRLHRPETAAAMAAAMLSAADVLARETGARGDASFRVEAGGRVILGLPATDDLMVLALLDPAAEGAEAKAAVERVIAATRPAVR